MRKIKQVTCEVEIVICDLCGAETEDNLESEWSDWEWFTGYRVSTFHACAPCYRTRRGEFDEAFTASRVDPRTVPRA